MISQPIAFEKLLNTRDLGGMTGTDGRKVRPGKLYRSGHLFGASPADLEKLSGMIDLSVDFRSVQECSEKPEPAISGVTHLHIPILEEQRAGVTRDEDSFAVVRKTMMGDSSIARTYMMKTYIGFITNPHSLSGYERFIRLLLEDHEKGILWHCTAGKDRAGFGTVIVQELLGVSREDIEADYMLTNVCLEPEIRYLTDLVRSQPGVDPDVAADSISYIFSAKMEYLQAAYAAVEEHFGSFDAYLTEALHLTPDERSRFQDLYLE